MTNKCSQKNDLHNWKWPIITAMSSGIKLDLILGMIIYQVNISFLFFKNTDTEKYWKYQYSSTFMKWEVSVFGTALNKTLLCNGTCLIMNLITEMGVAHTLWQYLLTPLNFGQNSCWSIQTAPRALIFQLSWVDITHNFVPYFLADSWSVIRSRSTSQKRMRSLGSREIDYGVFRHTME